MRGQGESRRRLTLDGLTLEYTLYRGAYKNINLRIRNDGSVRVSASRAVSVARIEEFLRANEAFIVRAMTRLREAEKASLIKENPWHDGGTLAVFGKERQIRVREGEKDEARLGEDAIYVTIRENTAESIRSAIWDLLEIELKNAIEELRPLVERRFSAYGVPAHTYRFRYMVSMWGSCCPSKKAITFNKYLCCVPLSCIEYVMVHETAHFLEMNHSAAFWRIVESILPDYKERKRQMLPYGRCLRRL